MSISSPALVSARSSTRLKSSRAQIKAASFRHRPTRKDWLFLLTPPKAPSPFKNNNQRQEKFGNKGVQQRNILTLLIQEDARQLAIVTDEFLRSALPRDSLSSSVDGV